MKEKMNKLHNILVDDIKITNWIVGMQVTAFKNILLEFI